MAEKCEAVVVYAATKVTLTHEMEEKTRRDGFFSGGGLVTAATRRWCGGGGDRRQRLAVWVVQIRAPFEGGVEMAMGPFTVFPQ